MNAQVGMPLHIFQRETQQLTLAFQLLPNLGKSLAGRLFLGRLWLDQLGCWLRRRTCIGLPGG
jgi:hypothetical protein